MSLLMTGWLELDDLQGPFQPLLFYDSMTARMPIVLKPQAQTSSATGSGSMERFGHGIDSKSAKSKVMS